MRAENSFLKRLKRISGLHLSTCGECVFSEVMCSKPLFVQMLHMMWILSSYAIFSSSTVKTWKMTTCRCILSLSMTIRRARSTLSTFYAIVFVLFRTCDLEISSLLRVTFMNRLLLSKLTWVNNLWFENFYTYVFSAFVIEVVRITSSTSRDFNGRTQLLFSVC